MSNEMRDQKVSKVIFDVMEILSQTDADDGEFRAKFLSALGGMVMTPTMDKLEPFSLCMAHFLAAGEMMRVNIPTIGGTASDLINATLQFFAYMSGRCVKDDAESVDEFIRRTNFVLKEAIMNMKKMQGCDIKGYNPTIN